jgi:hypothetical protein
MANTPTERFDLLRQWLLRLVGIVLGHGGPLASALQRTVQDREAVAELDGVVLQLRAEAADGTLRVTIEPGPAAGPRQFRATADALRDVIAGRALLDAAVVDGRIAVKAPLPDLLAMHDLAMRLLASGPQRATLRELWAEFDASWPRGPVACGPLHRQRPRHGRFRERVPLDVLLVRLDDAWR